MNYVQLKPAELVAPAGSAAMAEPGVATRGRMLVWDLPVRLFHWSLALAFCIAGHVNHHMAVVRERYLQG